MPAIPHDPKADIQLIRNLLLRAGYEDGLPVLKELLQNADDAGSGDPDASAKNFWVVLAPQGLRGATHPLLSDRAGLCILNDGDFKETDATCLPMLGLSSKAAEKASVGKFGIGLKTVFFLSEVFFFFSHREEDWSEAKACELVNPWGPKHRQAWEAVWTDDARHVHRKLFRDWGTRILRQADLQEPARFVGIWIPLRLKADAQPDVIHAHYPTSGFNSVFGERWAERVHEFMPLLRRVRNLRALVLRQDGQLEQILQIAPAASGNAQFMRVGSGDLQGGFELRVAAHDPTTLRFCGREVCKAEAFGTEFQASKHWPRQAVFGDTADQLERATPHGAVTFTRRPASDKGGRLLVQHAVFLPLSDVELKNLSGSWDYCVFLHGFYFVDSSRRHIERYSDLPGAIGLDAVSSEEQIRQLWNRTLVCEVIAPLMLPSLEAFVGQEGMDAGATEELVHALTSSTTLTPLKKSICRGQRFIPRLQNLGTVWVRQSWAEGGGTQPPWIELPGPGFPEAELFNLLPALTALSDRVSVSLIGKPRISDHKPTTPSDEELAQLLTGVSVLAFDDARQLAYLLELIPEGANQSSSDSPLTMSLIKLANQLVSNELPEEGSLRGKWLRFFRRLPLTSLIPLPCVSTRANPEIARALAEATLRVGVLWEDSECPDGTGTLDWESLLPLLQSFGGLHFVDEVAVRQRSAIVVRLLQSCEKLPCAWTDAIAKLPLFDARTPSGAGSATSIAELQTASGQGLLFTGGKEWAADLAKAAPALNPLLIAQSTAEILGLGSVACGAAACVALLRGAPRLAGEFASRRPLFTRILLGASPHEDDAWAALRCLLHGEIREWQQTATLFDETGAAPVLLRLLEKSLLAYGRPWRRIPAALVGQLQVNAEQKQHMRLVPAAEANIEALISEVGPDKVDCAELTREDCDYILGRFNDADVLRGLNIHETLDGRRVRVWPHSYVDDGQFTDLPEQFNGLVTRLRYRPSYARFANADGSDWLVEKLSWEAVIEIALDQPEPAQWWKAILTAIGHLGNPRVKLRDRLREIPWLPRSDGTAVAPSVLLHVPGAEAELDRLPDKILADRIPLLRLAQSVREHERFDTFKSRIMPQAKESLTTLAASLAGHNDWSTGLSGEWSADQVTSWVQAFDEVSDLALVHALPVARLIKALYQELAVRELLPEFLAATSGRLNEIAYANVLTNLASVHESADASARQRVADIFLRYLNEIARGGATFSGAVLAREGVRLMSEAGKWTSPMLLAFPTNGITREDILCQPQAEALVSLNSSPLEITAEGGEIDEEEDHIDEHARLETDLRRSAARLTEYFSRWTELVPREIIGAFLCILGDQEGVRNLAEQFLGQRTVEGTRAEIAALATCPTQMPLAFAFATYRFPCVVHAEPTRELPSVLGEPFDAHLGGEIKTIFFGDGVHAFPLAGNWRCRRLHLLLFEFVGENGSPERLADLLRGSAEAILSHVFGQTGISLRPLWDKLSRPSQLHIRIAQNRVLEAAQAFLRQVGAHRTEKVRRVLQDWDTADRSRAEAEENNRQVPQEIGHKLARAKQQLRELLACDEWTQRDLLTAVRHKMKQYQYDPSSVPFELWQNADDAVVELDLLGYETSCAVGAGFVVERTGHVVAFAHWGRLINEFQSASGHALRERGFDQDLEKMVIQSISDKRPDDHLGSAVTGKFGLGFKSVFLISDAPEVLSGHVDFVIRGGLYPVRLEDAQRTALEATLQNLTPDDRRCGTIIRLALRADDGRETGSVLSSFERFASLLVVFSRRLKRLRLRVEGQPQREVHWRPNRLLQGVEVGASEGLDANVKSALVFFRPSDQDRDRLQFLLGLSNDGVVPLPDDVPGFWVTTPTRATPAYGFAVNGPFEPDVGRVQLALQSEKNRQLAGDLAGVLAARLRALCERGSTDWSALRDELKLATGASAYDFWDSLWELLGKRFADKCRKEDNGSVAALARRILWESDCDGLQWFYRDSRALPTCLWGDYRSLTCLSELRHLATGALDREAVFQTVSGWNGFQERVAVGAICSDKHVASVLERLGVSFRDVETVHLATVVEWELGEEGRADPELASHLGKLITPEFMTGLEKGTAGEREESEHKRLVELLQAVSFQAADGSWHKASKLAVAARQPGAGQDEPMRSAFAPRECKVHPAYAGTALQFFLASRARSETGVEHMAEWVLQAADEKTRVAALRYLLNGELKDRLAEALRGARDNANWLWQLADFPWLETCFTADEQHEIRSYILRLFDEPLRQQILPPPVALPQPEPEPAHEWTVEELWRWWEQQGKPIGDYTLEGKANWDLFHGGPFGRTEERREELKRLLLSVAQPDGKFEGNALWYRLFGYACLVSAGRHTNELRGFWLQRLNREKFWQRTSAGDFSEETQQIFEQAVTKPSTDMAGGGEQAYFWRRVFYDIRKVHRLVGNDFPAVLLDLVKQGHGEHLQQFLKTGQLPGLDQQRWVVTFGQSSDAPLGFVIRELVRLEVITDELVRPSAFFVCRPVLRALAKIGWIADDEMGFSGKNWLDRLHKDPVHGPLLMPYYDIPLLHMGITHRGDNMPVQPQ